MQAKREQQQKRRKKNKYPHRMSRKGYIGVEEEVVSKLTLDSQYVFCFVLVIVF